MAEQRTTGEPTDEQQAPEHSPVEEEYMDSRGGTPAPRDGIMILGYSLGMVLVAVFALFLIAAAVAILVT